MPCAQPTCDTNAFMCFLFSFFDRHVTSVQNDEPRNQNNIINQKKANFEKISKFYIFLIKIIAINLLSNNKKIIAVRHFNKNRS